jgi:DNA-binding CsgD family transcriptional regulator
MGGSAQDGHRIAVVADSPHRRTDASRLGTWVEEYSELAAADRAAPLAVGDLERLAVAAYMVGRDSECAEVWARAHHECVHAGDPARASRCAFWLGMLLMMKGEHARGGGWLARGQELIDDRHLDCVERGYLLMPAALQSLDAGDAAGAYATFEQVAKIGDRFGDQDLITFGRLGRGQALVALGETGEGVAMLDQAMVAVTAGEVSPVVAGVVYCATIMACQDAFDPGRAQEWTGALSNWCASQPGAVPFRGQCSVHRAEILQLHGEWPDALVDAELAVQRLSGEPAAGMAHYVLGELHRLRGEFDEAEEAYRQASRLGRQPQPGLALLRLAQGQTDAAAAAIRRVLSESADRVTRSKVLAAYVEIMLAAGDLAAARSGAEELSEMATSAGAPVLDAVSAQATGAVLLAEGDAGSACALLRRAWAVWRDIEAPYESARARALIGLACRSLGDEDGAEMELDAARWGFAQLGAAPDLARVEGLSRTALPKAPGGLTAREVEVLSLVATGKTNRAIATELFLSEKTVVRHLSNIFTKLDVSSRAAATAYAYEHGLA